MKKTLALLISCTMILGSSGILHASSQTENAKAKSFNFYNRGIMIMKYIKALKTKTYDINHDGKINVKDMKALDKAFNTSYTDRKFNPAADLNSDKIINMSDRMLLMKYFSEHNIPIPAMPSMKVTPVPTPVSTVTPEIKSFDINQDGSIDTKDMEALDNSFNALAGDQNFNPAADLNSDNVVNMSDRMQLMKYFSEHNIPIPAMQL